jgi:hypothetical protein
VKLRRLGDRFKPHGREEPGRYRSLFRIWRPTVTFVGANRGDLKR